MGDPAGEEECDRRLIQVRGTHAGNAEEIADMIERHNDHDDATNNVDRLQADALGHSDFSYRRHRT